MKKLLCVVIVASFLSSCGDDSSTNPPDDNGNASWNPLSSLSLDGYNTVLGDMIADGNKLYVSGSGGFLAVVDILNPDTLKLLGYHASTGITGRHPIAAGGAIVKLGNYVLCGFTTDPWEFPDTVEIFDVTDPASPTPIASIASWKGNLPNDTYEKYSRLTMIGDTLAINFATNSGVQLYRISSSGVPIDLSSLPLQGVASCAYRGIHGLWPGLEYWYVYGVCIANGYHPKLWVMERGDLIAVHENDLSELPQNQYNTWAGVFKGTVAICWDRFANTLFEVDASNPEAVAVKNTISIPDGMAFPDGLSFSPDRIVVVGNEFVLLSDDNPGAVLVDGSFQYLKHSTMQSHFVSACEEGGILYFSSKDSVVAFLTD